MVICNFSCRSITFPLWSTIGSFSHCCNKGFDLLVRDLILVVHIFGSLLVWRPPHMWIYDLLLQQPLYTQIHSIAWPLDRCAPEALYHCLQQHVEVYHYIWDSFLTVEISALLGTMYLWWETILHCMWCIFEHLLSLMIIVRSCSSSWMKHFS